MKRAPIVLHADPAAAGDMDRQPQPRLNSGETRGDMFRDLSLSLRQPAFWSYSTWLDVATKYRRSRLGIIWLLVPSIFYVWGVGPFFASLQNQPIGPFVAHMGVGFLIFRVVLMVTTESSSVVNAHQSFILDGHTRLTDFVLRVLAKALFYFVMSLPVMVAALMVGAEPSLAGILLSLIGFLVVILNCVWLGAVIALLGARFPDIHELMASCFIFAFVFTPIVWYPSDAPLGTFRGMVMRANPLHHLIEIVRAPLLGGLPEPMTLGVVLVMLLGGCLLASMMYRRYVRAVPLWV